MSSNDFASRLLKKYGWSEGTGLGKNRTGIKHAIHQGTKKEDFNGVGFGADQFDPWWNKIYDAAVINIQVDKDSSDNDSTTSTDRKKRKKKRRKKKIQ